MHEFIESQAGDGSSGAAAQSGLHRNFTYDFELKRGKVFEVAGNAAEGALDVVFAGELVVPKREIQFAFAGAAHRGDRYGEVELHRHGKRVESGTHVGDGARDFDFRCFEFGDAVRRHAYFAPTPATSR